ncbi:hypothetical protein KKG24_05430 [Patescibacteria group bacterium]|nr:hypothetical protein [Patescibacteria group bacterium]
MNYDEPIEKLEIVKDHGEAAQSFNSVQDRIFGGSSSPPQAAKCVRTILRIQHQIGNVSIDTFSGIFGVEPKISFRPSFW